MIRKGSRAAGEVTWGPGPRLLVALWVVAFVVRLGAILITGPNRIVFGDSRDYLLHAEALCQGEYPHRANPPFFRAPGMPLVLALATGCGSLPFWCAKVGLAALDAINCVVLTMLAGLVWRSRLAALVAGWMAVFWPPFIAFTTDFYSEPLAMLAGTAAVSGIVLGNETVRRRWFGAAGVAIGVAALARPVALALAGVLAVAALLTRSERVSARLARVGLLAVGLSLVIGPWMVFVEREYGEVFLVNDAMGYNLWRGSSPEIMEAYRATAQTEFQERSRHFERMTSRQAAEEIAAETVSLHGRARAWRERAFRLWSDQPREELKFLAAKAVRFWRPWLDPVSHGSAAVLGSAILWIGLYCAAIAGFRRLQRVRPWIARLATGWIAVAWCAHVPFQVVVRFRLPWIEPWAIVLAAGAIVARAGLGGANQEHVGVKSSPSAVPL